MACWATLQKNVTNLFKVHPYIEELMVVTATDKETTNLKPLTQKERMAKKVSDQAKADPDCTLVVGGECDGTTGWFVQPTVIETANPKTASMCEEIFGPILTIVPYADARMDEALELCDTSTLTQHLGQGFALSECRSRPGLNP